MATTICQMIFTNKNDIYFENNVMGPLIGTTILLVGMLLKHVTWKRHMATWMINPGPRNGLLPNDTFSLPEPMSTYNGRVQRHSHNANFFKISLKITVTSLRGNWVNSLGPSDLTTIGSDNGLSPERCQAIIWTNAGILLIGPLWTNIIECNLN